MSIYETFPVEPELEPVVEPGFAGRLQFRLKSEFGAILEDGTVITVPAGYITDGMSIPRIFWSAVGAPYSQSGLWAALIHDWLYDVYRDGDGLWYMWPNQRALEFAAAAHRLGFSKRRVDQIFRDHLLVMGYSKPMAYAMWLAVKIGGRWRQRDPMEYV